MKPKVLYLLMLVCFLSMSSFAQRSIRIGYIDTEYILQNIPEYQEASTQLDAKVLKWKSEIDERLNAIQQKKDQLNSESVLLTKELIEERQEEITAEELEILDYQQKRFGPNGDLMIQKKSLIQPIQDQIFTAVQEIATNRNYDFVFDKSADVVMLYSADRFDISEQVLRSINRSSKREQAESRAERRAAEDELLIPVVDEPLSEREQTALDKKAERQKAIDERRQNQLSAREAKKLEIEEKKKQALAEREKRNQEKLAERNKSNEAVAAEASKSKDSLSLKANDEKAQTAKKNDSTSAKATAKKTEEKPLTDKEKRQKALEEKKKKILEARKKAQEEKLKAKKKKDSTENNN